MKRRAKVFIVLLLCSGSSAVVLAQENQNGEKHFEINMVFGYPQGSFEDNLTRQMPGIVFSFGGRTPKLPLILSSEIGWMSYGSDNFLEVQYPSSTDIFVPASTVNVATKNSMVLTHLSVRVVPFEQIIAPYVEGLVGFKYLSTNIDAESQVIDSDEGDIIINDENRIFTSSRFSSFALSYGFGAGINIQVFKGKLGYHNSNSRISIHAGAQYLFGSKANYLTEHSIRPSANRIDFERVESNTNVLIPKLGFHLAI